MRIERYMTADGKVPFSEWLVRLSPSFRARVLANIARMESGNFGDVKPIKGVYASVLFERRMFFGSGYRVYFGKEGDVLVLLLCGGDKSTQKADIARANRYWQDYINRKDEQ